MPSEIDICNRALSRIKKLSITSLLANSREAKECNTHYAPTRNVILRAHRWGFATKRRTVAALTDPGEFPDWEYVYQYPQDCLELHKIYNANGEALVPFDIGVNADLNSKVVLTNVATPLLVYTARVTNPNVFEEDFIDALEYRLAAELSIPLRGSPQLAQTMMSAYTQTLALAAQKDSNERYEEPECKSSLEDARL